MWGLGEAVKEPEAPLETGLVRNEGPSARGLTKSGTIPQAGWGQGHSNQQWGTAAASLRTCGWEGPAGPHWRDSAAVTDLWPPKQPDKAPRAWGGGTEWLPSPVCRPRPFRKWKVPR